MRSTAAVAPPAAPPAGWLPRTGSVLVVLTRPGPESADLGGLLFAFRRAGTDLALLSLTRGEASPLNSTWSARLEAVRPWSCSWRPVSWAPLRSRWPAIPTRPGQAAGSRAQ